MHQISSFDDFRTAYPARAPRSRVIKNQDELRPMAANDGLLSIENCWPASVQLSGLPRAMDARGDVYLWVIGVKDVYCALEKCEFGSNLQSKVIKHTNLTGGDAAHCGGELWFVDEHSVVVGGSSGRYGPETEGELMDAVRAFGRNGRKVASLGYDDETGFPATVLVGEPQWL